MRAPRTASEEELELALALSLSLTVAPADESPPAAASGSAEPEVEPEAEPVQPAPAGYTSSRSRGGPARRAAAALGGESFHCAPRARSERPAGSPLPAGCGAADRPSEVPAKPAGIGGNCSGTNPLQAARRRSEEAPACGARSSDDREAAAGGSSSTCPTSRSAEEAPAPLPAPVLHYFDQAVPAVSLPTPPAGPLRDTAAWAQYFAQVAGGLGPGGDRRWYAVWFIPGRPELTGIHTSVGPFFRSLLDSLDCTFEEIKFRRATPNTLAAAVTLYQSEAPRHGVSLTPRVFRW